MYRLERFVCFCNSQLAALLRCRFWRLLDLLPSLILPQPQIGAELLFWACQCFFFLFEIQQNMLFLKCGSSRSPVFASSSVLSSVAQHSSCSSRLSSISGSVSSPSARAWRLSPVLPVLSQTRSYSLLYVRQSRTTLCDGSDA